MPGNRLSREVFTANFIIMIMDETVLNHVKKAVRRLCNHYKYFLPIAEIRDDTIYLKLVTKDKMKEKIIVEAEFPLEGIIPTLHVYLKQLKESLEKNYTDEQDMEKTMKFVNETKKQLNDE